jgi:hypothetical protein
MSKTSDESELIEETYGKLVLLISENFTDDQRSSSHDMIWGGHTTGVKAYLEGIRNQLAFELMKQLVHDNAEEWPAIFNRNAANAATTFKPFLDIVDRWDELVELCGSPRMVAVRVDRAKTQKT